MTTTLRDIAKAFAFESKFPSLMAADLAESIDARLKAGELLKVAVFKAVIDFVKQRGGASFVGIDAQDAQWYRLLWQIQSNAYAMATTRKKPDDEVDYFKLTEYAVLRGTVELMVAHMAELNIAEVVRGM